MEQPLPVTPTFYCAHCARTQRLGARWGAGTADAYGRVFCTFECAWMALLIDEHTHTTMSVPSHAPAAAAATNTAATTRNHRRNNTRSTKSHIKHKSQTHPPPHHPNSQNCTPTSTDDGNWHALVGMAALLGE